LNTKLVDNIYINTHERNDGSDVATKIESNETRIKYFVSILIIDKKKVWRLNERDKIARGIVEDDVMSQVNTPQIVRIVFLRQAMHRLTAMSRAHLTP